MSQEELKQQVLNRAVAEALEKMRAGEPPLLDPAFEPELCYPNGCPVLPEENL